MITVALTMNAAHVASAEIGTTDRSLHGLLYKYGVTKQGWLTFKRWPHCLRLLTKQMAAWCL